MSALGQKQTYAAHKLMSALPPIATAKADIRKRSCLLYPRKRTCAVQLGMSALGQKRTLRSFDNLIGELLELHRYVDVQRFGSLEVDNKLILRRRLHRHVGW